MFEVRWTQSALDDLARVWLECDSAQRREITDAAAEIEEQLRRDPLAAGESREGSLRIVLVPPLGIFFHVYPGDRLAKVIALWKFTG